MLKITKETDYALLIVHYMNGLESAVSATSIADACQISPAITSKILKALTRAKLLDSTRGSNGGYSLAKDANEISIADILIAVEGPFAINECTGSAKSCSKEKGCQLTPYWLQINSLILEILSQIRLPHLQDDPRRFKKTLQAIFVKTDLIKKCGQHPSPFIPDH